MIRRSRLMLCALVLAAGVAQAEETGQRVFESSGCGTCHSVASAGIVAKIDSGPGLGTAAGRDADWLTSYLKQETPNGERVHPVGFSGDEAALELLTSWLSSLAEPRQGP